jgi:hypothetical protein
LSWLWYSTSLPNSPPSPHHHHHDHHHNNHYHHHNTKVDDVFQHLKMALEVTELPRQLN